jgi:hypothetical protein
MRPSRRHLLRAAGVCITLPYLESLVPRAARAQTMSTGPTRFIAMVHPQGFPLLNFDGSSRGTILYPTNTGTFPATLPTTLVPLSMRGVANEVMLVGGLQHDPDPASVGGAHSPYTSGRVLIGKNYNPQVDGPSKISSLDVAIHQVIGKHATLATQRLTLGMACRAIFGQGSGLTNADYELDATGNRIFLNAAGEAIFRSDSGLQGSASYQNGVEQDAINNPRLAFNLLFCGGSTTCPGGGTLTGQGTQAPDPTIQPRLSVLHYVADRIAKLKSNRKLGTLDAQKVDQYLTGIEDIEARITPTTSGPPPARTITIPTRDGFRSIPSTQGQLGTLMIDLIVKAFEANLMNVASLMMGAADGANITANTSPDATQWRITPTLSVHDHEASHGETAYDPKNGDFAAATIIATQKVDLFAYLISKLKTTSDVTGTLLDNTLVYYSSDFGDGNGHNVTNVPVMLAGHVPALVKGGTYARFNGVPAVRALVSAASQFGVTLPQANGQTGVL